MTQTPSESTTEPIPYKEFARRIKEKYPVYKDQDDLELARKITAKYPQYQVQFDEPANIPPTLEEAQLLSEFNPWVAKRKGELEAQAPKLYTQPEVDAYNSKINQQFKTEQEQKWEELIAKNQLPLPTSNEPLPVPAAPPKSKGAFMDFADMLATPVESAVRGAVSALTDMLPGGVAAAEAGMTGQASYDDILARRLFKGTSTPMGYVSTPIDEDMKKAAVENYIARVGQQQYTAEKDAYTIAQLRRRSGLLAYSDEQDREREEKMKGIPKTTGEVKDVKSALSWLGGTMGNVAGLAPAMVVPIFPYLLEKGEAYKSSLGRISEETGLDRDEVLALDLDEAARRYSDISGGINTALEGVGNLAVFGKFIPKGLAGKFITKVMGSKFGGTAVAAMGEGTTEFIQAFDTKLAELMSTGKYVDIFEAVNAIKPEEWVQLREEGYAGAGGGGGMSMLGGLMQGQSKATKLATIKAKRAKAAEISVELANNINQISPALAQAQDAVLQQVLTGDLTNDTQSGINTPQIGQTTQDNVTYRTPALLPKNYVADGENTVMNDDELALLDAKVEKILSGPEMNEISDVQRILAGRAFLANEIEDIATFMRERRAGRETRYFAEWRRDTRGTNDTQSGITTPQTGQTVPDQVQPQTNEKINQEPLLEGVQNGGQQIQGGQESSQLRPQEEGQVSAIKFDPEYDRIVEKVNIGEGLTQEESAYLESVEQPQLTTQKQEATQQTDNERVTSLPKGRMVTERTKVTVDEMAALKDQIKLEAKAAKGGASAVKTALGNLVKSATNIISGLRLTAAKQETILNRIGKVNLLNPIQVNRLLRYIEKVAADAAYVEKRTTAGKLIGDIKKNKGKLTNTERGTFDRLLALDPDDVSNIDEFISQLDKVRKLQTTPGTQVKTESIEGYVTSEEEKITLALEQQVEEAVDAELVDEKGEELKGPAIDIKLGQMATERVGQIMAALPKDHKDAKQVVDALKLLTPETLAKLNTNQLKDLVRKIDSILINGDYGGAGRLAAEVYAQATAQKVADNKFDSDETTAGKILTGADTTQQWAQWLYKMIGTDAKAAVFQALTYINRTLTGEARARTRQDSFDKAILKEGKRIKAKTGKDIFAYENQITLSLFQELLQHNTDETWQEGFDRAKKNIETDTENKAAAKHADYETQKQVWDTLSGVNSPEEAVKLMKTKFPHLYEAWNFLIDQFKAIEPEYKTHLDIVHGKKLNSVENYTPLRSYKTDTTIEALETLERLNDFGNNRIPRPKPSKTSKDRVAYIGEGVIRDRRVFDALPAMYFDTVFDIETGLDAMFAKATLDAAAKLNPKIAPINKAYQNRIKTLIGASGPTSPEAQIASELLGEGMKAFYVSSLGGVTAGILQATSIGSVIPMDLALEGKNLMYFFKLYPELEAVRNQYSIARRAASLGGNSEAKVMSARVKQIGGKLARAVAAKYTGFRDKAMVASTASQVYLDYYPAVQAWNAYYLNSLQDQGIDVDKLDLSQESGKQNEESRRIASAFAEQKVDRLLGSTADAKRAPIIASKDVMTRLTKATFFTFLGYPLNIKLRFVEALRKSTKSPKESLKEITRLSTEVAAVYYIARPLANYIADLISDGYRELMGEDEEDEEEKKKRQEYRRNLQFGSAMNELNPVAINGYVSERSLELYNYMLYKSSDDAEIMTFDDWVGLQQGLGEYGEFTFPVSDRGAFENLGALTTLASNIGDVSDLASVGIKGDDYMVVTDKFGNTREVYLDESTRNAIRMAGFTNFMAFLGIGARELTSASERLKKEKLK